jgi:hypothetical protein
MDLSATQLVTGGAVALAGKIVFDWFKQMQKPPTPHLPRSTDCSQVQAGCREERDKDRRDLNEFKLLVNNSITRIGTQVEGVREELERGHATFKEIREESRLELKALRDEIRAELKK